MTAPHQPRTCSAHQHDCPRTRNAALCALTHLRRARECVICGLDDSAGWIAEMASRALALHEQLDPLRDACDSVNLACDDTIVGWQGMAEQAATEAIEKLEAWLEGHR